MLLGELKKDKTSLCRGVAEQQRRLLSKERSGSSRWPAGNRKKEGTLEHVKIVISNLVVPLLHQLSSKEDATTTSLLWRYA